MCYKKGMTDLNIAYRVVGEEIVRRLQIKEDSLSRIREVMIRNLDAAFLELIEERAKFLNLTSITYAKTVKKLINKKNCNVSRNRKT